DCLRLLDEPQMLLPRCVKPLPIDVAHGSPPLAPGLLRPFARAVARWRRQDHETPTGAPPTIPRRVGPTKKGGMPGMPPSDWCDPVLLTGPSSPASTAGSACAGRARHRPCW